jgi:hypothetical protein
MKPGCIGKSNTNNLPAPTDLTENPYGKKKLFFRNRRVYYSQRELTSARDGAYFFFKDATQKSAPSVQLGVAVEFVPTEPIFEKCSHLREKGRVVIFSPGLYGGLYGQNLPYNNYMCRIFHTNLNICMVISIIATSKNHIELLVHDQI